MISTFLIGLLVHAVCAHQFSGSTAHQHSRLDRQALVPPFLMESIPEVLRKLELSVPLLPKGPLQPPYTVYIKTGNYKREEFSDRYGNIRGEYWYSPSSYPDKVNPEANRIRPFPMSSISFPNLNKTPLFQMQNLPLPKPKLPLPLPKLPLPKFPEFILPSNNGTKIPKQPLPVSPVISLSENEGTGIPEEVVSQEHDVTEATTVPTTTEIIIE